MLLTARSLRAFADGYVAVLLPAYLLALGYGTIEVGALSTVTMLGSAAATLAVGRWGHRFDLLAKLLAAAVLMAILFVSVDPITPTIVLVGLAASIPFTGLSARDLLQRTWPIPLAAVAVGVLNVVFAAQQTGDTVEL
ncbi:MAG: hypothetical protein ACREVB_10140, partial [Burkholderiales bacterium]